MVSMYTGTPGSGKSLDVARLLIIKAKAGKRIIANFPINPTKKQLKKGRAPEHWTNEEITPDKLMSFARKHHKYGKEGQTLLVIDECQLVFNCRDFRDTNRPKWIEFFSQHRKFGYDIILVTQHDRLLDRQVRAFVEYNVLHRKVNNFGAVGFILTLFRVKMFVAVTIWYGMRERCGAEFFIGRKRLYSVYDSYKDFRLDSAAWGDGEGPAPAGGDLSPHAAENTETVTPEKQTDTAAYAQGLIASQLSDRYDMTAFGVKPKGFTD